MQRDGFKCRVCEDGTETLNVHHAYYVKGRKCWNYPSFSMETLCTYCHNRRHYDAEQDAKRNNALPDDERLPDVSTWETELDWMLDGAPCNGDLWYIAAEIAQASRAIARPVLLKKIENFIASLRSTPEAAE